MTKKENLWKINTKENNISLPHSEEEISAWKKEASSVVPITQKQLEYDLDQWVDKVSPLELQKSHEQFLQKKLRFYAWDVYEDGVFDDNGKQYTTSEYIARSKLSEEEKNALHVLMWKLEQSFDPHVWKNCLAVFSQEDLHDFFPSKAYELIMYAMSLETVDESWLVFLAGKKKQSEIASQHSYREMTPELPRELGAHIHDFLEMPADEQEEYIYTIIEKYNLLVSDFDERVVSGEIELLDPASIHRIMRLFVVLSDDIVLQEALKSEISSQLMAPQTIQRWKEEQDKRWSLHNLLQKWPQSMQMMSILSSITLVMQLSWPRWWYESDFDVMEKMLLSAFEKSVKKIRLPKEVDEANKIARHWGKFYKQTAKEFSAGDVKQFIMQWKAERDWEIVPAFQELNDMIIDLQTIYREYDLFKNDRYYKKDKALLGEYEEKITWITEIFKALKSYLDEWKDLDLAILHAVNKTEHIWPRWVIWEFDRMRDWKRLELMMLMILFQ